MSKIFPGIISSNSLLNFLESTSCTCFYSKVLTFNFVLYNSFTYFLLKVKLNYNLELKFLVKSLDVPLPPLTLDFPHFALLRFRLIINKSFASFFRLNSPSLTFPQTFYLNSKFYLDEVHIFRFLNPRVEVKTVNIILR